MIVTNQNGTNVALLLVRRSIDDHRPSHSELVFHKYGNIEFLSKVFQAGSRIGPAVPELSEQEAHFMNERQHELGHSEVQK